MGWDGDEMGFVGIGVGDGEVRSSGKLSRVPSSLSYRWMFGLVCTVGNNGDLRLFLRGFFFGFSFSRWMTCFSGFWLDLVRLGMGFHLEGFGFWVHRWGEGVIIALREISIKSAT